MLQRFRDQLPNLPNISDALALPNLPTVRDAMQLAQQDPLWMTGLDFNSTPTDILKRGLGSGNRYQIRIAVERGADLQHPMTIQNNDQSMEEGFPLLWLLSQYNQTNEDIDLAFLMLEKGASIEGKTHLGLTALHLAVRRTNLPLIEKLLEKGANIDALDNEGKTPFHHIQNHVRPNTCQQIIHLLLKDVPENHKANVILKKEGNTNSVLEHMIFAEQCEAISSFLEFTNIREHPLLEEQLKRDMNLLLRKAMEEKILNLSEHCSVLMPL